MILEDRMPWTKNHVVPADYIANLECQMMLTTNKTDTERVDCDAGIGTWLICRNPNCHRCNIIEETEMETLSLPGKGLT
eukprot:6238681-Heterocapsa_arctica.AAC.1